MSEVEIDPWSNTLISTQTTTVVKAGSGTLGKLILPTPVASATVKIYDHATSATGRVLLDTITFTASPPVQPVVVELNAYFTLGCTVVTAGATMSVHVLFL